MGYQLSKPQAEQLFRELTARYDLYAPVVKKGDGCFSDTDVIRYEKVSSPYEIAWEAKSDYSFKEALLPVNETLFYFTEDETTVPKGPRKDLLIFLRSCDLYGVKRLDEIYLKNGYEDFYYARLRKRAKFILMGCPSTCTSGFCVSMGTNRAENYDAYLKLSGETLYADCPCSELEAYIKEAGGAEAAVSPDYVTENRER